MYIPIAIILTYDGLFNWAEGIYFESRQKKFTDNLTDVKKCVIMSNRKRF